MGKTEEVKMEEIQEKSIRLNIGMHRLTLCTVLESPPSPHSTEQTDWQMLQSCSQLRTKQQQ